MSHLSFSRYAKVSHVILALAALQLVGCSSPEDKAKTYYEHGLQYLAANDNKRAEIEFRNAIKNNRKLLPAWQKLAEVEELLHDWNNLIPALRGVIELDPENTATRIKLGRLLLAAKSYDEVLHLVNDVKEPASQNPDLLALKAAVLFKLNDQAGAVREAEAALKVDPTNAGALLVLAGERFASDDAKGALAILNSDALAKRGDVGVEIFKLRIFEKTHDLPQMEALLKKLVELYPKEIYFKQQLIRMYLAQHRNDDAEKEQRAIAAAEPSNTAAQLDLVRLLNTTKGPDAAQQSLTALISAGGNIFPYQIALAQFDFNQNKFSDAERLLKKLIGESTVPEQVLTAKLTLADMYLRHQQADAAQALVTDILNKDERNTAGLKLRAAIRMDHGELEGAITDLRQALNGQPRATDLMLMLAAAYERSGSTDLAEKEFANAMRASDFNPMISLNYVNFLQRRGSAEHAEDVLTDLVSRWPNNVEVLSALAQVRLARQEWAGAQEIAESLKRSGNNRAIADELLGAALAGRNKLDESIVALRDAYDAAPTAARPMYELTQAYIRAKQPDKATAFLQSVLKANPSNAEAYVLLGFVQLSSKMPDQARQSFMTAIEKQPKDINGYRALSDFYLSQQKNDEALKALQAGLKENPDNVILHLRYGDILERQGKYDEAISEYQGLLDKDPGSIVVANNLASLLADHRTDKPSLDRARAITASLRKSPVPQFKDTLGWISYRQGDYKEAVPLLEDAVAALPNVGLVHYHLGMSYVATGQSEKAAEQFKLVLDKAPNQELAEKTRAELSKIGAR
jgi:tetratricopeptide (TPR) repeat protein